MSTNKSNADYWASRFILLEQELADANLKKLLEIEKIYSTALTDIDKDLAYWYARYASNENITLAEAKRRLDLGELAAFKMTVEEYIKYGESLDPRWRDDLERASIRVHVTRLEALKLQIRQHIEESSAQMKMLLDDYAMSTYSSQYYKTAFEIQKGMGIGWEFKRLNKNLVEKVLYKPWAPDGKNFSDRIWDDRTKLVNEVHNILTSAMARGQSLETTSNQLKAKMKTTTYNAKRLVLTESAFFRSAATKDTFNNLDVEKYEICATLDRKTSQICRSMDGKVFDMKDFQVGVTAPPFHVHCRTATAPYFDDDEDYRASRDEDGKYKLVEDMTYEEWAEKYVKD